MLCMMVAICSLSVFASCLKEGDEVKFLGVVTEELYFGPPGWGEDKGNDQKIHQWILHLNKSLTCIQDADTDKQNWNVDIQLIMYDKNGYKTKNNLLGKEVTVVGTIFLAQTAYHMTSVLLSDASFIMADK